LKARPQLLVELRLRSGVAVLNHLEKAHPAVVAQWLIERADGDTFRACDDLFITLGQCCVS
jgi:hypothetical protein